MTGNALSATGFNTVDEEVLNLQDFAPTNTFGGAGVYFSGSTPAGNRFIYGQIQITYPGAAQLSLDKSAINFGNQPVGPTYAKQTVHLKNTGTSAIIFSGTIISGTGASAFASSSTCGTTIAPGDSCASAVTFTPTAPGGYQASLQVTDDTPQTNALSGNGLDAQPAVNLSKTSLTFGNQIVSTTSTAQTVTLTNTGTADMSISGLTVAGSGASAFAAANTSHAIQGDRTLFAHFEA